MNVNRIWLIILMFLCEAVHAQRPSSNDVSDNNGNTGSGYIALISTTGVSNSAYGSYALEGDTTGSYNTAAGSAALHQNTTGNANVAIGSNALEVNTASNNTATGYSALGYNTSGYQNVAMGSTALQYNDSGSQNVAIGYQALTYSTVSSNTAVGWQALFPIPPVPTTRRLDPQRSRSTKPVPPMWPWATVRFTETPARTTRPLAGRR